MNVIAAPRAAVVLTAVSLFSQGVGFLYRVALSRMVGAEVMGLYQLVMPVFSVLLSLTAVGFTAACSNLSAHYYALGDRRSAAQAAKQCVWGFLCAFAVTAGITAPLSDFFSVRLLGDARTRLGVLLLLPCVLLTGLENIHKHVFYGSGKILPPAACEVCEQLIRAGSVLGLLWWFLPQNPERTVGLIVCGMILCEVFSAVTLTLLCRRELSRPSGKGTREEILRGKVWGIAVPVGATALLGNLMGACTSVMIPQRLVRAGADVEEAMARFGVLCGMTAPMLSLPLCCVSALGLVLTPRLAESAALGKRELSCRRLGRALEAAAFCLLPACGLLAAAAPTLGQMLFREEEAGAFAVPLAAGMILSGGESIFGSALNGLGRQKQHARNSLICGAFQLAVTYLRMSAPGVGLRGYVEGFVLSALLGLWLNAWTAYRAIGFHADWFRWIVAPGLGSLLAALNVRLLLRVLLQAGLGDAAACAAALGLGAVIYLIAMGAMGWRHL